MDIKKIKKLRLELLKKESTIWWKSLPMIDLGGSNNSWVGYCQKYYSHEKKYFYLDDDEILNVYIKEKKNK